MNLNTLTWTFRMQNWNTNSGLQSPMEWNISHRNRVMKNRMESHKRALGFYNLVQSGANTDELVDFIGGRS